MSTRGIYWMTGISTAVAVAALGISVATFVVGIKPDLAREGNAEKVARAVGAADVADVRAGRAIVRQNSFADQYLYTLTRLWEAAEVNGDDISEPSAAPSRTTEGWKVCTAALSLFGGGCHVLSEFQYSDTGQVDTFSIDNVPLAEIVQYSWNDPSSKNDQEFEVRVEGAISSPDRSVTTYLFRLNPSTLADNTMSTRIVRSFRQDIDELTLEGGVSLPTEVPRFEEPYGFVSLPGTAGGFVYFCSEYVPEPPAGEQPSGCQWAYF